MPAIALVAAPTPPTIDADLHCLRLPGDLAGHGDPVRRHGQDLEGARVASDGRRHGSPLPQPEAPQGCGRPQGGPRDATGQGARHIYSKGHTSHGQCNCTH